MTDFFYNKESYYINMSDENKKNVCCSTHDWEIPKENWNVIIDDKTILRLENKS